MQNQIPESWQTTNLAGTATLNYGKGLPETKRIAGSVPVYGSSGVSGYHNVPLVEEPGYIIGRKGTVGTIYYSNDPFYPIDTVYYATRKDIKCDFKFFNYLLKSLKLDKLNADSAVPGLNRDTAYAQKVLLPTMKEQQKIAEILSAFDDKIEVNNKIAKTLEEMAQAIFKEWFVNSNKENWRMGQLEELMDVSHGYAFPSSKFLNSGDVPVIKIKNILEDRSVNTTDVDFINYSDFGKNLDNFKLRNGDIILAMTGATSGKVSLLVGSYDTYMQNQRVGKFNFKKNYYKWFCYLFLTRPNYRELLLGSSDGSAQGNLSPDQVRSIELVIPTDDILEKFNTIVDPFFEEIIKNRLENQKLAALRDLLLPKLMRGEISV